ncbi:hypothetical protein HanXRQr2_Chr17g0790471 [Helianthus annuus]|uniref:Uncharacterized protein n=1 Tax=Helianthus annuus TaxID=4232 RepID=A0A9K3GSQ4_HELAN|nr:hypothetical protein HanXRQr2_Chr17g0790471 [Helianthus annuus]
MKRESSPCTTNGYSGWNMGYPNSGFKFINILTTAPTGYRETYLQVFLWYFNI